MNMCCTCVSCIMKVTPSQVSCTVVYVCSTTTNNNHRDLVWFHCYSLLYLIVGKSGEHYIIRHLVIFMAITAITDLRSDLQDSLMHVHEGIFHDF